MNISSMLRFAKNVAKTSEHRYPMAAVIVHNGKPISVGINQIKTHPDAPRNGLHAECHAIKCSGKYDLAGATIFVYRQKRNGEVGMARPCPDCLKILKEKGFKYMYYTTNKYPFFDGEKI
jgi:tRNA(Arg) A34 adenosine deaminase TadA